MTKTSTPQPSNSQSGTPIPTMPTDLQNSLNMLEEMDSQRGIDRMTKEPTLQELRDSEARFMDRHSQQTRRDLSPEMRQKQIEYAEKVRNIPDDHGQKVSDLIKKTEAFAKLRKSWSNQLNTELTIHIDDARRKLWQVIKMSGLEINYTEEWKSTILTLLRWFCGDDSESCKMNKGLYLWGEPGRGKSLLMQLFQAFALVIDYRKFEMANCKDLVHAFASSRSIESISKYYSDMWCFEDLGYEDPFNMYGNKINVMEEILIRRYDSRQMTLVTTNMPPEAIAKVYGARVESRMHEMFNFVKLEGIDFRKQK